MNTEQPKNYRRRALLISAAAAALVYILWNIPELSIILYPLRLFTTYVHEAGHSLAALLTGGQIEGFVVYANGAGKATTAGGARWLILPAGYLGAAMFGSLLFYTVNTLPRFANTIAWVLGGAMVIFTLLFARPDEGGALVALVIGVLFGFALIALGLRFNLLVTMLVLNVLAISTALEAFFDLRYLIGNTDASLGPIQNDVTAFTQQYLPLFPPDFVALVWAGIALLMFGVAFWLAAWKPLRREIDESFSALKTR